MIEMNYIINKNTHEVHIWNGCDQQPHPDNRESLGFHASLALALQIAKGSGYSNANRCELCFSS